MTDRVSVVKTTPKLSVNININPQFPSELYCLTLRWKVGVLKSMLTGRLA